MSRSDTSKCGRYQLTSLGRFVRYTLSQCALGSMTFNASARPVPARLHLLEQMIEGAADFEFFLAALHMHDLVPAKIAADLVDRIDANHG